MPEAKDQTRPSKSDGNDGLRKQISQRDRVIQSQKDEIAGLKEVLTRMENSEREILWRLSNMVAIVKGRDEIIALEASLSNRLIAAYKPEIVAFVNNEIAAMQQRLAEDARVANEAEQAEQAENRA